MEKRSLKAKLILFFILFAFIPAAIGGAMNIYMNVMSVKSSAVQGNSNTAAQVAKQIEIILDDSKGMVEGLALGPTARSLDPLAVHNMITAIQQKNPQFILIFTLDANGNQVATTAGNLSNRSEREYFQQAMKGETFITQSYISVYNNAPCVTIASPIKNSSGTIIGVMAANINFEALKGIAENFKVGKDGYIEIVDRLGIVVAHPNNEKVLKEENFSGIGYVQKVIQGQLGAEEAVSTRGEKSLITFAPIAKYKWGVIVNQPMKEISAVATSSAMIIIAILIISILLATITAFYVVRSIVDPLQKVVDAVEKIAEGDLCQVITVEGVLEVNQLVQGVNHMTYSLRKIIIHTASVAESVAASAEELTAVATNVMSDMNHCAVIAAETDHASDTTAMIDVLGEKSRQINEIVENVANSAHQINLQKSDDIATTDEEIGPGGKFAIVADEVRKLAEHSQKADEKIAEMMNVIQSELIPNMQKITDPSIINSGSLKEIAATRAIGEHQNTSVQEIVTAASGLATMACELQEVVSKFKI